MLVHIKQFMLYTCTKKNSLCVSEWWKMTVLMVFNVWEERKKKDVSDVHQGVEVEYLFWICH